MSGARVFPLLAWIVILLGGGCSPPSPAGFSVQLEATAWSVAPGGSVSTTVSVACEAGRFAGSVVLDVRAPDGVTGDFAPSALDLRCDAAGTLAESGLTLDVGVATPLGLHEITVVGSGAGATARARATLLVVQRCLDLRVEPATLTLRRGQRADVSVTVDRAACEPTPIELTAAVTPAAQHIDVSFEPAATVDASVMTVAVGLGVPPGVYRVAVQGVGAGSVDVAPVRLFVVGDDSVVPVTSERR